VTMLELAETSFKSLLKESRNLAVSALSIAIIHRVPSETVWKSERGRSMTYAPEYGKVLSDRSFGR